MKEIKLKFEDFCKLHNLDYELAFKCKSWWYSHLKHEFQHDLYFNFGYDVKIIADFFNDKDENKKQ